MSLLAKTMLGVALAAAVVQTAPDNAGIQPKIAFAEPGISPDGKQIAFVSGGDIWDVPAGGGEARLLVSHPAAESRPLYSPDGRQLAFVSTRTGNGDIYVLTLDTGELRRVTFDDAAETLNGWTPDSKAVLFSSVSQDVSGMNDIFRVDVAGGTPMPLSAEAYFNEYFGAISPDATQLAFSARGIAGQQWWRHGHSHLDESEIWLRSLAAAASGASSSSSASRYTQVTASGAKALWPMWSGDGQSIFFMADRNGAENIWRVPVPRAGATPLATDGHAAASLQDAAKSVTDFKDGRVLWPSITKDGKTIAFERDFGIWTLDTTSGRAQPVAITRRGAPAGLAVEHERLSNQFSDLALSPDGKKIVFAAHGDIFAASAKDGGDAMRLTATADAIESDPVWTSDSRRVVYVSARSVSNGSGSNGGGSSALHVYDVATNSDTTLTSGHRDYALSVAPNGSMVAFMRDKAQVCTIALAAKADAKTDAKAEHCIAQALVPIPIDAADAIAWSPDSKWIAFVAGGAKGFSNVQVVPADGSAAARAVSFVPNVSTDSLTWSPDGTFLMFATGQRTEASQAARVDLVLRTPKFREDQFRDLFPSKPEVPETTKDKNTTAPKESKDTKDIKDKDAKDAEKDKENEKDKDSAKDKEAKKPPKKTEIVFDDIRQRLSYLPIGLDVNILTISHDGKTLLLGVVNAGQENLYLYSIDELAKEHAVPKQLTTTAGSKSHAQFSPDDKEVWYLDDGKIQVISVDKREPRPIAVSAELDVDFTAERQTIFDQAWSMLNENFYDPQFHGANWTDVHTRFASYAAGAANNAELRRLMSLMIGELNASHLGISGPPDPSATTTGHLGLRFDPEEYARSGRLKITNILPLGPAAVARNVAVGDIVTAINGTAITRTTNLDQLLDHTIGKRTLVTVESAAATGTTGKRHDVPMQPVNLTTDKGLRYRQWVEDKRAYVAKISNGRLGYVHMIDMGSGSLSQLYADLDVENQSREGVIIDIRNNNGGFVNAYALDVFARRPYLGMTFRDRPLAPGRTILGQRALESPTILVVNQHSLSDAEDFTEGYRALKLGEVVGEPTAGWIIYTGGTRLIDGSVLRLPRIRITDHEGKDMERHPRQVDVLEIRNPGEDEAGVDHQLQKAATELLAQLRR